MLKGVNPDIAYPIWYRIIQIVWNFLGMAWLASLVGAKLEYIKHVMETRKLNVPCEVSHFVLQDTMSLLTIATTETV